MTAAQPFFTGGLDEHATRNFSELQGLFMKAPIPESVLVLNGSPKGRLLSLRYFDNGLPHSMVAALARLGVFPWDGKDFRATTEYAGQGVNRIKLILPSFKLFSFFTRIGPSAIDGRPCILLDYDQPGNPWFVRRVRDELREVAPGLFLGSTMVKVRSGEVEMVLWFGIDSHHQA